MDPALPRGGLYKIFQLYDAIKSHATRDDGPAPWEPDEDQVKPGEASSAPPQTAGGTPGKEPDITTFGQPSRQNQAGSNEKGNNEVTAGGTPGKEPDATPFGQPSRQKQAGSFKKHNTEVTGFLTPQRRRESDCRRICAFPKSPDGRHER